MIALLEAKREREKRAALAAGDEPKEPSEIKRATMPAWMLAIEKVTMEAAWARWLQHIADVAAAKRNVRK